jgi:formylmethanofuran dehydrogenase subunit E
MAEDEERCSRCGDEMTDTNRSDRAGDDMCRDCRYEYDLDGN